MSMFGIKEAEVAQLVRAVTSEDLDRVAIEDRFARATWSGLAEPGDRIAGALVAAVGAPRALAAVVHRRSAEEVLGMIGGFATVPVAEVQKAIDRWTPRIDARTPVISLRQAARYGVRLRVPLDVDWPVGLDELAEHAPLALWTRGTDEAFAALAASIALVGARAATGYGEHVAMEASAGLVDRGYAIVSGAAYGIDGMAHRAALASGGMTIAFLAGGVDRFYPSGHDGLLTRIVERGCVVSELPCGSAPTKWRFLQRNRLIAAASQATVVLEAGWRSGSLNTAGHAASLGRPLGAVPGPVTSAASAGCHRLIRDFIAVCVTNPDEMAELAPLTAARTSEPGSSNPLAVGAAEGPSKAIAATAAQTRVLDALAARSARSIDDVAARCGMSLADVRAELGRLELEGSVSESPHGWRKRPA